MANDTVYLLPDCDSGTGLWFCRIGRMDGVVDLTLAYPW